MKYADGLWRSRWAAVGAATAVTIGLGGALGLADATVSSGSKPVFVPITPCRLLDTRSASTVGPKGTPIGADAVHTVTVHGTNGNCTIPAGAVAITMNTTITNGSAGSVLTVYPADASRPTASALNWVAGQAPTPNEITVKLSADGKISMHNLFGTVDVIGDVVGYFEDHQHGATNSISLPAQALNETSASGVITRAGLGLLWTNSFAESANLTMHQPEDFAGTGTVTLKLLVSRTTSAAGNVQFFARPRDYNDGDGFLDSSGISSNILTTADQNFHEVTIDIPAASLSKDWWDIVIQRDDAVASAYTGDVLVRSVELTYTSTHD